MEMIIDTGKVSFVEFSDLYRRIRAHSGNEAVNFVINNLSSEELGITPVLVNENGFFDAIQSNNTRLLVDFADISLVADLVQHFRSVNEKLAVDGIYIGCFESKYNLQLKLFRKYNRTLSYFILMVHYVFRNFFPFWKKFTRKGKSFISSFYKDNSLAEVLGKLVYCGFEVINYCYVDNLTYFIIRKKKEPATDPVSSSRFFVKLRRVGKNGNMFTIYKLRTMYPYSEFIQDYVVKINGLDTMGKPKNDFRITRMGKMIRKVWIDELPQFLNLLKGDIRLIGVRPISRSAYNSLPPDLQKNRIRYKPGLIPPQTALRLKGLTGTIQAERQFLDERAKNPVRTDLRYFFQAVFNIITFRVKSS